jgi:hypothetical protein
MFHPLIAPANFILLLGDEQEKPRWVLPPPQSLWINFLFSYLVLSIKKLNVEREKFKSLRGRRGARLSAIIFRRSEKVLFAEKFYTKANHFGLFLGNPFKLFAVAHIKGG